MSDPTPPGANLSARIDELAAKVLALGGEPPATLRDLVTPLGELALIRAALTDPATGLPAIAAALGAIAVDTRRLAGTAELPELWRGLPGLLSVVLGTPEQASIEEVNLISGLARLVATLPADAGRTADATEAIVDTLPQFASVLTDIASYTLRSAVCCEEGGGGPGDGGGPPDVDPPDVEPGVPTRRITGWIVGPEINVGESDARIYYPDWGSNTPVLGGDGEIYHIKYVHSDGFTWGGVFSDSPQDWDVVVQWVFPADLVPVRVASLVTPVPPNESVALSAGGTTVAYGTLESGGEGAFLETGGANSYWQIHFVFGRKPDNTFPTVGELGLNCWAGAAQL